MFDGILYRRLHNNLIFIDILILKLLSKESGLCQLYWGEDFFFDIEKSILIDIHNYNNITFCYDHRKKLEKFSNNIRLTKQKHAPGWFSIENI